MTGDLLAPPTPILSSRELWFASGNAHKTAEIAAIMSDYRIKTPADAGIDFAPEETGRTFVDNAMIKARDMYAFVREPVIADDSGLCIDILNGRPGIYSARFGNRDGVKLSDAERNACVLREFEQAISCGETSAKAHYVCAMVLLVSLDRFFIVQETLEGEITSSGKGANGFGYDPIFYLPEKKCTLAELPDAEKNAISHRGKAAQALLRFLR